jgi:phosphoglycolate phosphatase-like HAD superfamily hydrolase
MMVFKENRLKLLLFDIDGTLIRTGGVGRHSMALAFEELYHIPNGFDSIQMMGRTDPSILNEAMTNHGLEWNESAINPFRERYCTILQREIVRPRKNKYICQGIPQLLQMLNVRSDTVIGLLTGNWKRTAMLKLNHFGIDKFFKLGVYADDAYYREDMVPVALTRWEATFSVPINPADIFVIGDTPLDITCARPHGVRTVGVATGFHSFEELAALGPDLTFEHFGDWKSAAEKLMA